MKKPPIVAVLGHIDHGKTSLLSKIREQDLTKKEFGGITQHIGAYQVKHKGKPITFIDTPGHAAFSKMRSRGAQVTDLVVLVVAANDGVMPQTKESLEHIRAAKTPFLVAINKIDLSQANPQKVKEQLQKEGILVEGLGGDIVCVEVSAKTGKGIDELLELILLSAEMQELKANPKGELKAVIIESFLDRRRGPLATVLVQNGTLRLGEKIKTKETWGKAKAMFDENSQNLTEAGPSQPVKVLGFKKVPLVGSIIVRSAEKSGFKVPTQLTQPVVSDTGEEEKKIKIILKSDVYGTLEAIKGSLTPEVRIISQGVGDVNESDIFLAATTKSEIIAFNVKIPADTVKLAKTEKVKTSLFNVIYELLEAIEKKVSQPEEKEIILGRAEILAEFKFNNERVAGCRVTEGRISKSDKIRLQRGERVVGECRFKSMRYKKEDINIAQKDEEFGAVFKSSLDFQVGDIVISHKDE